MTLTACIDRKTIEVPSKEAPMWWHLAGKTYTKTGYGRRIPTRHMVQLPGSPRWRRVYCYIFSNSGTCFVDGPKDADGKRQWIVIA